MVKLNKLSLVSLQNIIKEEGEVILKDKALQPDEIAKLRENGIIVSHQYCDELGEIGYKAYK